MPPAGLGDLVVSPRPAGTSSPSPSWGKLTSMDPSPGTAIGRFHPTPPDVGGLGRGNAAVGTRCVPLLVPCCHPALNTDAGLRVLQARYELRELCDALQAIFIQKVQL